eukprot:1155809-Rhodomonas_salina.1
MEPLLRVPEEQHEAVLSRVAWESQTRAPRGGVHFGGRRRAASPASSTLPVFLVWSEVFMSKQRATNSAVHALCALLRTDCSAHKLDRAYVDLTLCVAPRRQASC